MRLFEIDSDIRNASTLPSEFYTDPAYFEMSKDRIFARTWQLVSQTSELQTLTPQTILPGFLDEPVLLAKKLDKLHCLSNVCTHRGKILIDDPCDANLIRCSYHGRRFSLDGKLISMPEFDGVRGFPAKSDDLTELASGERGGFFFASLDPIAPLEDFVDETTAKLADLEPSKLKPLAIREYQVDAHWALYCENYLEGFHIPYVHRDLNEVVDYGTYKTETFKFSSLQTGFDETGNIAGLYLFVFPNLMFNFYPWGLSINVILPVTPSKTVVEYRTYVSDETQLGQGAGADLHAVELEDEAVVESVQHGIRSRFYKQGRYSPTREQGTHHFHRLIADFIG